MVMPSQMRAPLRRPEASPTSAVGAAYSEAGQDYLTYADGDAERLFDFSSHYSFGDRYIWSLLDTKLKERRWTGAQTISILDAGCGPGTWLRRLVTRALELGFTGIRARGIDLAAAQIDRARRLAHDLKASPRVDLSFEVGDLSLPLAEADDSFDLTLCLYCVFNHLTLSKTPALLAEIARVTRGRFVTTVRAAGSMPTIYVDSIEHARAFRQDNATDRCEIELDNGRRITLDSHLFTAHELRGLVERHFAIEDLRGLDLFHGRFAPDPRWNPAAVGEGGAIAADLAGLEATFAADPRFIDRAAHLLAVGWRKRA